MLRRLPEQRPGPRPNNGFPVVQHPQMTGAERVGPNGPDVPGPDGQLPPWSEGPAQIRAMHERAQREAAQREAAQFPNDVFQQFSRELMARGFPRGRQP